MIFPCPSAPVEQVVRPPVKTASRAVFRSLPQLAPIRTRGKFLFEDDDKLLVRGVTYGTFRPNRHGEPFPERDVVRCDFAAMRRNGFNAVRLYTAPPEWLLELALHHHLRVMIGLPWEQHMAFLDDRPRAASIEDRLRIAVARVAGHPAVLCYAVGNEIPAPIVRWHGRKPIEKFIERLWRAAKAEDPDGLVTYVNFPSTEYLCLPFLDFVAFNVYLETQKSLTDYLARLHNLAGDRPLILGEIGLDSRRRGEWEQARSLDWQIRATFASGCAGAFVFSWTDEWHRGGSEIEDWDFGLTTRQRRPKPALAALVQAFSELPLPRPEKLPGISVVVCSCNGARTLRQCLEALQRMDYPDYEVIVINDGSADETPRIAEEFNVRLINTDNHGLSSARNTGLAAAEKELVAYIDDDAYPDRHWLAFLAAEFLRTEHAGIGGPNIAPAGDGVVADAVANAPGGPVHVLLSDSVAEHIPGCNMAFRKHCLKAIGGFDPQFRAAGDDVDLCWRLQERGWTLGFSPAATVWHHRRNSIRAYWRQQKGYGKAEALLERKWPEKYNAAGHLMWSGRLYGKGLPFLLRRPSRIYHGVWGTAPFQMLEQSGPSVLSALPALPEWYLVIFILAVLSVLSLWTSKLWIAFPLLLLAGGATCAQAFVSAHQAVSSNERSRSYRRRFRAITMLLHLLQPAARLSGRLAYGLTIWRQRAVPGHAVPVPRELAIWSGLWQPPEQWLSDLVASLRRNGLIVLHGRDYDRWDLEVRTGMSGATRLFMTIEEHGSGKQLLRLRTRPFTQPAAFLFIGFFATSAAGALLYEAWSTAGVLGLFAGVLSYRALKQCAGSTAALLRVAKETWVR